MSPTAQGDSEIARIVSRFTHGNTDAFRWFLSVLDLSNLWDHIADGDPIDKDEADSTIFEVAVCWGLNSFYRQHSATLSTVALNAVLAWKSSDRSPKLRAKAFDVATELGTTVAFLVGGPENAITASAELRRWSLMKQNENDSQNGGPNGSMAS